MEGNRAVVCLEPRKVEHGVVLKLVISSLPGKRLGIPRLKSTFRHLSFSRRVIVLTTRTKPSGNI
jgi:hypothetical protein